MFRQVNPIWKVRANGEDIWDARGNHPLLPVIHHRINLSSNSQEPDCKIDVEILSFSHFYLKPNLP